MIVSETHVVCVGSACGTKYPVVHGAPVLINEENSVFRIKGFADGQSTFFRSYSPTRRFISSILPSISSNQVALKNLRTFFASLMEERTRPKVLVIGGSIAGSGFNEAMSGLDICLLETDVAFGPRTQLFCDCHDIPFRDETFHGVVAQAVLEHVIDPSRCVSEIHRVLKPEGLAYVEVPFMQQVHGGAYDFTRFSHLGLLRLFRHFEEVKSGVACGPGMALSWAYCYFLMSFSKTARQRMFLRGLGRLTSFFWKWWDPWLVRRPGAIDAASAFYLVARKVNRILDDRDLLARYRGIV